MTNLQEGWTFCIIMTNLQEGWTFCMKYSGLYFSGSGGNKCPVDGKAYNGSESGKYLLIHN